MASFTPVANKVTKYLLNVAGVVYPMEFSLIDHGDEAASTFSAARNFHGVADSFPPLEGGGLLAFNAYDTSLHAYLIQHRLRLVTNLDGRVNDCLKAIMWDLGVTILHCASCGIKLDIDPDLYNVYVSQSEDYPRVKVIALPGAVPPDWNVTLVNAMTKMKSLIEDVPLLFGSHSVNAFNINDMEFDDFVRDLARAGNIFRSVQRCFRSIFFWNRFQRLAWIDKLGELVENAPRAFIYAFKTPSLLGWRDVMKNDNRIGYFVQNAEPNTIPITRKNAYEAKEIDCLLKFLRANLAHFATLAAGYFGSTEEWLDHYEFQFPSIMTDIYKGAVKIEVRGVLDPMLWSRVELEIDYPVKWSIYVT